MKLLCINDNATFEISSPKHKLLTKGKIYEGTFHKNSARIEKTDEGNPGVFFPERFVDIKKVHDEKFNAKIDEILE